MRRECNGDNEEATAASVKTDYNTAPRLLLLLLILSINVTKTSVVEINYGLAE